MSSPIITPADCCTTCTDVAVTNIPGPKGDPGLAGSNGTNGINAFTNLTAAFTQPAVSANVTVAVANSSWAVAGEIVYVAGGGYYQVSSIPDGFSIILTNLGYTGNAAPAVVVPSTGKVAPGGIKGADGTNGTGDMLKANNLSDVASVAASRNNLGLGSLAVLNSINNGNWSGTALAIGNGGTGATIAATALSNLGGQPVDGMLTALSALTSANNDMLYFTGADTPALLHSTTSFGRSALLDADAVAARSRMGKMLPRYGCLGFITGVDLNAGTTDNAITIESARYRIALITVENPSINTTTATAGLFTAAGGAGTTLAADQALSALSATTKFKDLALQAVVATDVITTSTLYFRVGTAQGSADTADVFIFGWKYD